MKRVTYKDIAEKLGISKAAVGYALNNSPKVSEKTRAAVVKIAKELGHRPDPALSALAKHRWGDAANKGNTYSIAVIVLSVSLNQHDPDDPSMFKPVRKLPKGIYNEVYETMREQCETLGFLFSLYVCHDITKLRLLARILFERGTNGVILHNNTLESDWNFPIDRFSAVVIGQSNPKCPTHNVAPDWFGSMKLALDNCQSKGYKRIGFASFDRGAPDVDHRYESSFVYHCGRITGNEPVPIFRYPLKHPTDFANEYKRFQNWYETWKPEVIIDSNHFAFWWLDQMGIQIPEQTGLIHLSNSTDERYQEVSLVDFQSEAIGRWSVNLISRLIQMNELGRPQHPIRVTVPCQWFERQSLRLKKDPVQS
jgi:DNA-binding LacI/PurR family transcriptional regulator